MKVRQRLHTRATPSADPLTGLVRYSIEWCHSTADEVREDKNGKYVLHSEAAKIIAAKDAEIERICAINEKVNSDYNETISLLNAKSTELAQIKAQKPVAAVEIRALNGRKVKHIYPINLDNVGAGSALYAAPVSGSLKADRIERELDGYIQHFSEQKRIAPVHVTKALSELKRRLLSTLNVETSNDKG